VRVLLVDPDLDVAGALAAHFSAAGWPASVALDGLEALYALDRETPDLVVLDLDLPVVSGFRLLFLLRRNPETANIPAIVLTSLSFQEALDAIRAGADDFIAKPAAPEEVLARARQLLARTSRRADLVRQSAVA
jgi:DNA-binding response OmpR family regulator